MMPVRRTEIGSGITARKGVEYSGADTFDGLKAAVEKAASRNQAGFAGWAAGIKAECQCFLSEGQPGPHEVDSHSWYAEQVLSRVEAVEVMIAAGNAEEAALASLKIGALLTEARLKGLWERQALIGEKVISGARDGHAKTHGSWSQRASRDELMIADLRAELESGTKLTAARRLVAERHGVSEKTVQRAQARSAKS